MQEGPTLSKSQQEIAAPESTNENRRQENSEQQEKKNRLGNYFSTKRITQLAAFIALALVMKIVGKALTFTPTMTATLIYIPWLLSGIVLGPVSGLIVCSFSDILGNLVFSGMSGFNPLTLLSNTLYALPVALLYKTKIKNDYLKTILGSVISLFVCTLGIGSFALYWYWYILPVNAQPIGYIEWFFTNRWFQPIVFAVNLTLLCLLIKPLQKVGIFPVSSGENPAAKYSTVFAVSIAVLTAVFITVLTIMIATGSGSVLTYVMVPGIYAGLAAFLAVSAKNDGRDRLFYNGIISIALALLTVACGVIIPLSPVSSSYVPSGWFYLVALIPAASAALPLTGMIKADKSLLSKKTLAVNAAGIAASFMSLIFLILMITLTITGII